MVKPRAALDSGEVDQLVVRPPPFDRDELLFEAPRESAEAVAALVKQTMAAAVPLRVPLDVDVGIGENWKDAKS